VEVAGEVGQPLVGLGLGQPAGLDGRVEPGLLLLGPEGLELIAALALRLRDCRQRLGLQGGLQVGRLLEAEERRQRGGVHADDAGAGTSGPALVVATLEAAPADAAERPDAG